jgi:hypothetical protein
VTTYSDAALRPGVRRLDHVLAEIVPTVGMQFSSLI